MSLSVLHFQVVNAHNMHKTPRNSSAAIDTIAYAPPSAQDKPFYLFKYLVIANMCKFVNLLSTSFNILCIGLYLEAGALPAMLIQISNSFGMPSGQQGLLGGISYLSLGFGSPIAGFLLRRYEHKTILGTALFFNSAFTLCWALTPVGHAYSMFMFITIRFVMGLMQCVVCVYLPLWTNEHSPKLSRARWMGSLQASVPFGVMSGYVIAAVMVSNITGPDGDIGNTYLGLLCWRWPIIVEWFLLLPFLIGFMFVPKDHFDITVSSHTASMKPSSSRLNLLAQTNAVMHQRDTVLNAIRRSSDLPKDKLIAPLDWDVSSGLCPMQMNDASVHVEMTAKASTVEDDLKYKTPPPHNSFIRHGNMHTDGCVVLPSMPTERSSLLDTAHQVPTKTVSVSIQLVNVIEIVCII